MSLSLHPDYETICFWAMTCNIVMAGLVPAIHVLLAAIETRKTWMPAT